MKYLTLFTALFIPSISFANENSSRDQFVKDIVIALIETQAAHVSTEAHVITAYKAWEKYQELANQNK
jgi:hypothetical protein